MSDSIHDEISPDAIASDETFFALSRIPMDSSVLKVYQVGDVTVVRFIGPEVTDNLSFAEYRDELLDTITRNECQIVAFDLTGVRHIPSGMLGVLASIRKQVAHIEIYNCSPDVIEVLQVTHLDRIIEIKEVAA